jgi:hypothetical protein
MPFDPALPRSFTNGTVRQYAPAASGLYGLSDSRRWIYIGESDNIQASLLGHLSRPEPELSDNPPTGFVFESCDRSGRGARYDRLVQEYAPAINRLRR